MLTAEEVKAHAATNLTRYKLPRIIEFRATLPKTDVGKILRRELRDAAPASNTFTAPAQVVISIISSIPLIADEHCVISFAIRCKRLRE